MRNCQPGAYYAGAGRRVAEADLRHMSVSDHPTTDIRETCTFSCSNNSLCFRSFSVPNYQVFFCPIRKYAFNTLFLFAIARRISGDHHGTESLFLGGFVFGIV